VPLIDTIAGAGHMPMVERPEQVVAAICAWDQFVPQ
jgi:pimeloyl-ACP methyl ester carboxylesterase